MPVNMNKRIAFLFVILGLLLGSLLTFALVGNHSLPSSIGDWMTSTEVGASGQQSSTTTLKNVPADFAKILEAYEIIQNSYYDKEAVDANTLIEGAIKGMINVLNDPYTTYMNVEQHSKFEESLGSSFEGIGTEVMIQNNRVTIVSPFKDSPAEKAGLRPNDQIISVDGENIEGMDLNEAVKKIRGPKGTKVKLEIYRPGVSETFTVVVTRDTIPLESVYSDIIEMEGKKIGKIEITSFSENTAERFKEEYDSLKRNGVKGIVIDVRGNPGGYLQAVLGIAGRLIPQDQLILQVEDRDGNREVYRGSAKEAHLPLVVLTDEGSASASEILAAALKDSGVPVVGATTFGKGTVQVAKMLDDGSSIKITIAKWLTPNGTWIHEKGIEPTIQVQQPDYFYAAPIHTENGPIQREMNGAEVQNVQLILRGLGYDTSRNDGYFDESTEAAVRAFQKDHNLNVTGVIDEETAEKMQEKLIEKIRDPNNDLQLQKAYETLNSIIR